MRHSVFFLLACALDTQAAPIVPHTTCKIGASSLTVGGRRRRLGVTREATGGFSSFAAAPKERQGTKIRYGSYHLPTFAPILESEAAILTRGFAQRRNPAAWIWSLACLPCLSICRTRHRLRSRPIINSPQVRHRKPGLTLRDATLLLGASTTPIDINLSSIFGRFNPGYQVSAPLSSRVPMLPSSTPPSTPPALPSTPSDPPVPITAHRASKSAGRLRCTSEIMPGSGVTASADPFQSRQCSTLVPVLESHEMACKISTCTVLMQ